VSVVLQGGLHHYDSLHRQWLPLPAGGVQVIQSGSGLSHAERVGAHTRMFQIWLDPNLAETLAEAPAYTDYAPHAFSPQAHAPGLALTPVAGLGGPVALRTPGAVLYHATAHQAGTYTLPAQPGSCAVAFVQEGAAAIEGVLAQPFDAVAVPQLSLPGGGLRLETQGPARLFVVQTPARPAYRTYHERALGGE
jgi:redox-sensitive bicupin YhaK (pirin superfamily)